MYRVPRKGERECVAERRKWTYAFQKPPFFASEVDKYSGPMANATRSRLQKQSYPEMKTSAARMGKTQSQARNRRSRRRRQETDFKGHMWTVVHLGVEQALEKGDIVHSGVEQAR